MVTLYRLKLGVLTLCIPFLLAPNSPFAHNQAVATECQPFPIQGGVDNFPEVQGYSAHQELWALLFTPPEPFQVNEDVKIVWRMTGTGTFNIIAQQDDGTKIQPIFGPTEHGGSNWNRPGQEWGTGFHFPKVGCWRILITFGPDTGEADFLVIDRSTLKFF